MQPPEPPTQPRLADIACVLFDKDGTVVCFHSMWTPWAEEVADAISRELHTDLRLAILRRLGVEPETMRTGPGLLAEGTKKDIADAVVELAAEHGVSGAEAEAAVRRITFGCDLNRDRLRFIDGTRETFELLRARGLRIGVCTSDDRAETEAALDRGGLRHLVDAIACGDDPDVRPKPHASGALALCERVGAAPDRTVMVGDTSTDMRLGRNAGLAACVGVLSGIGTPEVLRDAGATHLVASVAEVPSLLGL